MMFHQPNSLCSILLTCIVALTLGCDAPSGGGESASDEMDAGSAGGEMSQSEQAAEQSAGVEASSGSQATGEMGSASDGEASGGSQQEETSLRLNVGEGGVDLEVGEAVDVNIDQQQSGTEAQIQLGTESSGSESSGSDGSNN